jgi:hypothetical protein
MKTASGVAFALLFIGLANSHAASPFKKVSGDELLHTPSSVLFPPKVSVFTRGDTDVFRSNPRDVSVRYFLDAFILCDVSVYAVGIYGNDLNEEFQIQQNAIRQLSKNVKLLSKESRRMTRSGHVVNGVHATYELQRDLFGTRNRKCGSEIFVFRDGPWFVAYRFSYPRERLDIAHQHVAAFVEQWHWRER